MSERPKAGGCAWRPRLLVLVLVFNIVFLFVTVVTLAESPLVA